jgi:hypothetical protein
MWLLSYQEHTHSGIGTQRKQKYEVYSLYRYLQLKGREVRKFFKLKVSFPLLSINIYKSLLKCHIAI